MEPERRAGGEFRVQGRTLTGVALRYGDVSPDFQERFLPGSLAHDGRVDVNLQHDAGVVLARGAALTDGPRELRVRADLPEGSAALQLVRRGALNGFSIEFNAQAERREAGIRVIERATLSGLALVDRGAYPQSVAEVRARSGRTIRQRIPTSTPLSCECSGLCKRVEFMADAMREAIEGAYEDAVETLAVRSNYGTPLASSSRGTLRATMEGDDAIVEVDLPTGPDGDAVLRDIENTGAVVVRPYLDRDLSEGDVETRESPDDVLVYRRILIRSFVVGATDARGGWPEPEIIATPGMDGTRAAPRRRRLWL